MDDAYYDRSIRTRLRAGRQDRREVEHLSDRGMSQDVCAILVGLDVVDELEESDLMVNHEQDRIVLVEAHVFESFEKDFRLVVTSKSSRRAH